MNTPSIGIVASRFNEKVTERLLDSCIKTLKEHGAPIPWVVRVPGAFEIPWAVQELARSGSFDVVISLGCVMAGQTEQNRHLARATVQNVQRISIDTGVPVILGVITPRTEKQAMDRTKGRMDRGKEAAMAALDMSRLRRDIHRSRLTTARPAKDWK